MSIAAAALPLTCRFHRARPAIVVMLLLAGCGTEDDPPTRSDSDSGPVDSGAIDSSPEDGGSPPDTVRCPPPGVHRLWQVATWVPAGCGGGLLGSWLSGAGDLDRDGYDDILVGARTCEGTESGVAYLFYGRPDWSGVQSAADADVTFFAEGPNGRGQVIGGGDFDGDGAPDLAVSDSAAAATYLFLGGRRLPSVVQLVDADVVMTGPAYSAALGDVDDDGRDDLLLADFEAVHVVRGREGLSGTVSLDAITDARIEGVGTGGIAAVGDVDADGVGDIAVGDPLGVGRVRLFQGGSPLVGVLGVDDAFATLEGADGGNGFDDRGDGVGATVAGGGDADGDGIADFVVGAPGVAFGDIGAAYLLTGPAALAGTAQIRDAASGSWSTGDFHLLGSGLDLGEATGDRYADILVGAPSPPEDGEPRNGAVYLVCGAPGGPATTFFGDADHTTVLLEETALRGYDASAGAPVAIAGDVDGDGLPDLLVAATGDEEGGPAAGGFYLVLGASIDWPEL